MAIFRAFLSGNRRQPSTDRVTAMKRESILSGFDLLAEMACPLLGLALTARPHLKESLPMKKLLVLLAFGTLAGCDLYFAPDKSAPL